MIWIQDRPLHSYYQMFLFLLNRNSISWWLFFFLKKNCCLAAPRPTLSHYRGGSLTHQMLITCVLHIWPEGHREPRNGVGSIGPAERLVGFEPGTFQFWSQCLNPLGHSPPNNRPLSPNLEKSIQQILLAPDDRNYLRFISFKDNYKLGFAILITITLWNFKSVAFCLGWHPRLFSFLKYYSNIRIKMFIQTPISFSKFCHRYMLMILFLELIIQKCENVYWKCKHQFLECNFDIPKFKWNSAELEQRMFNKFVND